MPPWLRFEVLREGVVLKAMSSAMAEAWRLTVVELEDSELCGLATGVS
jgi:hypothetical protein